MPRPCPQPRAQAVQPPPPPPPANDPMPFAEELDTDLGASLARARRLAQMKEKAKNRKARDVGEVQCVYWFALTLVLLP